MKKARSPRKPPRDAAPATTGVAPTEKLHKVMADAGLGSRREMERWIEAGRVTVNGQRATLGDRINVDDQVTVDGAPLHHRAETTVTNGQRFYPARRGLGIPEFQSLSGGRIRAKCQGGHGS